MHLFSPGEIATGYIQAGAHKTRIPALRLLLLSILAGLLIAFCAAASSTATFGADNASMVRLISGLIFPFGLGVVMLTGAELFTGNALIVISVLEKRASILGMLRNWGIVYLGNFLGALTLAGGCVLGGQLNQGSGALAVFTIKAAVGKCAISFGGGLIMGFFCNILVCAGVWCGLSAKDTAGRILGCYIPVSLFVICGFEHCVANMYYIPAGIFAAGVPGYARLAAQAGLDLSALGWGSFLINNLLPVTLGNVLGGLFMGSLLWYCHLRGPKGGPQ